MDWIKQHRGLCLGSPRPGAFICILIALAIGFGTGCHSEPTPQKIIGAWMSRDERFEGRVLRITPASVEITVNEKSVVFYSITSSRAIYDKRRLKVMLHLEDQQQSSSNMMLNYNLNKDSLWLESRPDILWYRFKE